MFDVEDKRLVVHGVRQVVDFGALRRKQAAVAEDVLATGAVVGRAPFRDGLSRHRLACARPTRPLEDAAALVREVDDDVVAAGERVDRKIDVIAIEVLLERKATARVDKVDRLA